MGVTVMRLTINGESRSFEPPLTVDGLLGRIGLDAAKVAVERNLEIVPRSLYGTASLDDGDRLEIAVRSEPRAGHGPGTPRPGSGGPAPILSC